VTALAVARGSQRLLTALGRTCVSELALPSGRRADLVALADDGEIWIVEIKSSIADFRADQKWQDYRMHCDRLLFATAAGIAALKRWTFDPQMQGDVPVDGELTVRIHFHTK